MVNVCTFAPGWIQIFNAIRRKGVAICSSNSVLLPLKKCIRLVVSRCDETTPQKLSARNRRLQVGHRGSTRGNAPLLRSAFLEWTVNERRRQTTSRKNRESLGEKVKKGRTKSFVSRRHEVTNRQTITVNEGTIADDDAA